MKFACLCIPKLICCISGYKWIDFSLYASFQNPMSYLLSGPFKESTSCFLIRLIPWVPIGMFHRTQHPLSLCFIGFSVLCLYVSHDSMSSSLCFHRTQCPPLYVFIGLNVLVFMFHRTQRPLSLCFYRTQRPLSLYFIGLNILCLYVSYDSTSSAFMFHRTQRPLSLCFTGLNVLIFMLS